MPLTTDALTNYEFWCFFRLAEELAKILGNRQQPLFSALESDEGGLRYGLSAELGNGYQLVYNRTFKHGEGSYSVSLRPDFSLMKGKQLCLVFDAKFRFDDDDISQLSKPLEEEMEKSAQEGDIERLAKHADICKMHTYRDALIGCRAAVVVFPGTQRLFFRTNGKREDDFNLSDIAQNQCWKGVGALPLVPK